MDVGVAVSLEERLRFGSASPRASVDDDGGIFVAGELGRVEEVLLRPVPHDVDRTGRSRALRDFLLAADVDDRRVRKSRELLRVREDDLLAFIILRDLRHGRRGEMQVPALRRARAEGASPVALAYGEVSETKHDVPHSALTGECVVASPRGARSRKKVSSVPAGPELLSDRESSPRPRPTTGATGNTGVAFVFRDDVVCSLP